MFKKIVCVASVTSFVLVSSPAAFAQSLGVYDPHANFGLPSEVSASVYMRIPFNGGLKRKNNEEARFGFAVSTTMPKQFSYSALNYGNSFQGTGNRQIKVLDISIGATKGFKSLKLNGQSFTDMKRLYADGDDEKKNRTWLYVLGGAVAAVGIIVIIGASKCENVGFGGNPGC